MLCVGAFVSLKRASWRPWSKLLAILQAALAVYLATQYERLFRDDSFPLVFAVVSATVTLVALGEVSAQECSKRPDPPLGASTPPEPDATGPDS